MRCRRLMLSLLPGLAAGPALGQAVVTSRGPEGVSVTVYRDLRRDRSEPFNLNWLNGYALITEKRTVRIPAGEADIRFEGVAGGILPESAIVSGLPAGVVEKNQDAYLLSPASLLDASLGRRVHVRRTSRATGKTTETDAVIRSGADGAVVLETPGGIETLRCTGLPETLIYDRVPEGLSAKPTLSVRTRSPRAARATLTLSYLASGFDWQADYVAELSPDRTHMDLFAWLTLANGDETGFVRADTQAVAGRLNREEGGGSEASGPPIHLQCWPQGTTTSDLPEYRPPPPAPPPSLDLVVTGREVGQMMMVSSSPISVITADQEELGDLKLYRIPEPVTVAARSQKQVALLHRERVPVEIVYRGSQWSDQALAVAVTRNRDEERLGIPLPSGQVAFFETGGGRRLLVGQGRLSDRAVGEEVEIEIGRSIDVRAEYAAEKEEREGGETHRVTVTNAKPHAVPFEAYIAGEPDDVLTASAPLATRDGNAVWRVEIPANGSVTLHYRLKPGA